MSEKTTGTLTDAKVTELDKALASVKARKAAKQGTTATSTSEKPAKAPKAAKEPSAPKRPRLTDEQKAEREAEKTRVRNEKKAARDAARATKKAERDAAKQPAHMRKVMKAAEKLGTLDEQSQLLFNEATANLSAAELAKLANHIQHFNRVQATQRALSQSIEEGMSVRIVGGDPRFIGQTGTVAKAQRIRCYVTVEGAKKPVYLFTSDVEPVTQAAKAAAAS
jgi:flagellar biosynthesis GTPase FlhF